MQKAKVTKIHDKTKSCDQNKRPMWLPQQKGNTSLVSEPSQSQKTSWDLDLWVELIERRAEDHHEEWDGLKSNFEPYILLFRNREPGHVTTFKRPNWSKVYLESIR